MTVLSAAQADDEVATLIAMRDRLAEAMDDAGPNMLPQLSGRLESVLARLSELRPSGKVTLDDALAERRVARAGRAESQPSAAGKAKRAS